MIRSIKISLKFATKRKIRRLISLTTRLRKFTNKCISYIWDYSGSFDDLSYKDIYCSGKLSHRQIQSCWRQAVDVVTTTRKSAKPLGKIVCKPRLKNSVKLSSPIASIGIKLKSFDYFLKVSGLVSGKPVVIPFKSHKRLNYWLSKPDAKLKNGCIINKDCTEAILWIDVPSVVVKEEGKELGFDTNYATNLLTDSENNVYGEKIKEICEKVNRKRPGSNDKRRAMTHRDQYIAWVVKNIPWKDLKKIVFEDLTNIKKGKSKKRSRSFRRKIAPWSPQQVLTRSSHLAQENGVRLELVDPKNTSKRCPECGTVSNKNREGEKFSCVKCRYTTLSGHSAARNIIAKTSGTYQEFIVPDSKKSKRCSFG